MKYLFKKLSKRCVYKAVNKSFLHLYKKMIECNSELGEFAKGEVEWLAKWRKYDPKLSPLSYRIFSRYIGEDMNILPLELCANVIEPILTPSRFLCFYADKNLFDKYIPKEYFPKTLLRNIRGVFYDVNYCMLRREDVEVLLFEIGHKALIVKPSLEASGVGVRAFFENGKFMKDKNANVLSLSFLDKEYKKNYLIQEFFNQSEFTSFFNNSSVNTIRIATYRDCQGSIHVLNAGLRIGAKGANVDNAHAGGGFCGISVDGKIGNYVCDWLGNKKSTFNDIDFSSNNYVIPNFDKIRKFAINVSSYIMHHDLIALDIVLDRDNNPKLLEINAGGFGGWFFQFTSGTVFGEYTDEVMTRCFQEYKNLETRFRLEYSRICDI